MKTEQVICSSGIGLGSHRDLESKDADKCELKIKIYSRHILFSPEYVRFHRFCKLDLHASVRQKNHKLDKIVKDFETNLSILLIFVQTYCPQELICPTLGHIRQHYS